MSKSTVHMFCLFFSTPQWLHFGYCIIGPDNTYWINLETNNEFNRILVTKYFRVVLEVGYGSFNIVIAYTVWDYYLDLF